MKKIDRKLIIEAKKAFEDLYLEYDKMRAPRFPDNARCLPNYFSSKRKTNGLTQSIIGFIRLNGWFAERITSAGRCIDNRKIVSDVIGRMYQIGSKSYIPGTSQKGTADISAVIEGKSVRIEVKNIFTKDKMSEQQKEYAHIIDATGGIYFEAQYYEQFYLWFKENFKVNENRLEVYRQYINNKSVII